MSHQNIVNGMLGYTDVTSFYENDVYMAYLPLAHVLELISGTPIFSSFVHSSFYSKSLIQRAFGCYLEFQLAIRPH